MWGGGGSWAWDTGLDPVPQGSCPPGIPPPPPGARSQVIWPSLDLAPLPPPSLKFRDFALLRFRSSYYWGQNWQRRKDSPFRYMHQLFEMLSRVICKVSIKVRSLPVQARIEYKLLTLTFKCVQDKAPTFLSELILRRVPSRPGLRSPDNISLFVPKTQYSTGEKKAQQIVLFLCLPLNCGTSFLLK